MENDSPLGFSRRRFLVSTMATASGMALAPWLAGCSDDNPGKATATAKSKGGLGKLEAAGPELSLPSGFQYVVLSVTGAPMTDGIPTPKASDGMAAFVLPNGNVRLVRNHEERSPRERAKLVGDPALAYDRSGGGAVTALEVEPGGRRSLVSHHLVLAGTLANCSGGPTPWGSWLSCEETTEGRTTLGEDRGGWDEPHGYVFEAASSSMGQVRAVPLKAMGRFAHEAVAIDPKTGMVYQTEDNGYDSGLYRFVPEVKGRLAAGGRLQMLAIKGQEEYDTAFEQPAQARLAVHWVDITDPDPSSADSDTSAVFNQGLAEGGARFKRLEGCTYSAGSIYFSATEGGDEGLGQIWEYRPDKEELHLVYESRSDTSLDGPDNLAAAPWGGLVICEDGGGEQFLRGLTSTGQVFDIAANIETDTEFAGACFSPDNQTLFVNVQGGLEEPDASPSKTFAIWGPWAKAVG